MNGRRKRQSFPMQESIVKWDEPLNDSSTGTFITLEETLKNPSPSPEPEAPRRLIRRSSKNPNDDPSQRFGKSRLSSLTSHFDKMRKGSPRTPRLERFNIKRDQFAKMASIDSLDLASPAAPLRADAGIYSRTSLEVGEDLDDYFEVMRKRGAQRRSRSDTAMPLQGGSDEHVLKAPSQRRAQSEAALPEEETPPHRHDELLLDDYFFKTVEHDVDTDADTLGDTVGASTFAETFTDTIWSEPARLDQELTKKSKKKKKEKKSKKSKKESKHNYAQIHFESSEASVTYSRVPKSHEMNWETDAEKEARMRKSLDMKQRAGLSLTMEALDMAFHLANSAA